MLIYKINKKLSRLKKCVFCNKYVSKDNEYVAVYYRHEYKLAHRKCFDNYFLNSKKGKNNE